MCGWCFERIALKILSVEQSGQLHSECNNMLGRWLYLREAVDFPQALQRIEKFLISKKLVVAEELPATVVLLRSLEILVKDGFTSTSYQGLVQQDLVRNLIVNACKEDGSSIFIKSTEGLSVESLAALYDPATYLTEAGAQALMNVTLLIPACQEMLKHYHSWWLLGDGLAKNNLDERMAETGIFDPIEDIAEDQHERFDLLLRATYFSLLLVSRDLADSDMFRQLVKQHPVGIPWFKGDDLWLQRVAALALYDMRGFDSFLEYLQEFRATLFYYIDQRREFTPDQKRQLLDATYKNPGFDRNDDYMSIKEWLSESVEAS